MMTGGRPALARGCAFACLLLLNGLLLVEAKVQAGHMRLGGAQDDSRWHYAGKFGYAIGTGTYEIRLRMTSPPSSSEIKPSVDMDIFLDQEWGKAEALPECHRARDGPARKSHRRLEIGRSGSWSEWQGGSLQQVVRPHVWYFALSACRHFENRPESEVLEMDYEIRWRQFDNSELSIELRQMPTASLVGLLGMSALLLGVAVRVRSLHRSCGRIHPVVQALVGAAALQWFSQALHLAHLIVYKENGVGVPSAEVLADVLAMLSQTLISILLIAIAQGYSLRRVKQSEATWTLSLAAFVAILHVALVLAGKLQGEAHYKFHDQEGAVGWMLLAVRISLFACFLVRVRAMHDSSGYRLQNFLHRFKLAGSAYFLAFPLVFLTVKLLAPYVQHPVLQLGLLTMQTGAGLWLAELFLSRGSFFEVSELSSSLLPGGAGCASAMSRCKEE